VTGLGLPFSRGRQFILQLTAGYGNFNRVVFRCGFERLYPKA